MKRHSTNLTSRSLFLVLCASFLRAQECGVEQILGPIKPRWVSASGNHLGILDPQQREAWFFRFEGGRWLEEQVLPLPIGFGDISIDGERLVISWRSGIPVVYRREDGEWIREAELLPDDPIREASFGQYVSLSGDLALVAEHDRSRVHVFHREGFDWIQEATLFGGRLFGWHVALDGDRALIGTGVGSAFVYRRYVVDIGAQEVEWELEGELSASDGCARFGQGVAISGNRVLVGGSPDFGRPEEICRRVYAFQFDGDRWVEKQILQPAEVSARGRFGTSVSLDGDLAAVVAYASQSGSDDAFGNVYVYRHDGDEWRQVFKMSPPIPIWGEVAVSGVNVAAGGDALFGWTAPGIEADFITEPETPATGEEIVFEALVTSEPGAVEVGDYEWDFGDGEDAEGKRVLHRYAAAGQYEVSLTLRTDDDKCLAVRRLLAVTCPGGELGPWSSAGVGEPAFPGSARLLEGEEGLAICAGGSDISGDADQFHYVYRDVSGDGVLTARLDSLSERDGAKAGLMVRASSDSMAPFAALLFEKSTAALGRSGLRFRSREESGARATSRSGAAASPPNVWLRLERQGSEVITFSSQDGQSWSEAERIELALPERFLVGIAATARVRENEVPFEALEARFSGLENTFTGSGGPARFRRGDANQDGREDIADAVHELNFLFSAGTEPSCADAADVNDDGAVNITDPVFLLGVLFAGGAQTPEPAGRCGLDPSDDDIGCERSACAE